MDQDDPMTRAQYDAITGKEETYLRDTFAAAALTGILAHQTHDYGIEDVPERVAWAYKHADAMMHARSSKKETP